jgi:Fe-S-cluster containining protein
MIGHVIASPRVGDTAFPFHFRCRRSGNCCARPEGIVRVTAADVARIAEHLEMTEATFRSRYVAAAGDRLVDGLGHRCAFLEDGRHATCSIYPARPKRCRSWPFWPEHRDPAALAAAARVCPGITLDRSEH